MHFNPDLPSIIVVDDNIDLLELYEVKLRGDFNVYTADSMAAAFELLNPNIAAVVTDLHMPEGSGKDLIEAIREFDLDLPIFIVTADQQVHLSQVTEWGASGLYHKPFDSKSLISSVLGAIRARAGLPV